MSANSRITIRCGGVYFTFSRWLNSFLIGFVADSFRDMLADSVLQTLRSSAHVPAYQYQYVCRCKCRYVGRTSQRLQDRIRQHVPKTICNKTNQERIQPTRKSKINSSTPNCDSTIGTHLLKHPNCALHYNDNQFSILSKARSEFHLAVLESIHIASSKPALCRQKEFVYRLKLST